jgi:hypothetical protein
MRNKLFVAEHRGGQLSKVYHHKLMRWARKCSEHVLHIVKKNIDKRLIYALTVAKEWENNNVPTGDAIKASLAAHAVARESSDPVLIAITRSIGHATATAHMADHLLGAALYALKALYFAGISLDKEREWQNKQLQKLPPEIVELVPATMIKKEKSLIKLKDENA